MSRPSGDAEICSGIKPASTTDEYILIQHGKAGGPPILSGTSMRLTKNMLSNGSSGNGLLEVRP